MTNKFTTFIFLISLLAACAPNETPSAPLPTPLPAAATAAISTPDTSPTEKSQPALIATVTTFEQANERTSPIDGMPQVFVPAGTVRMGGLDIHADDRDEFPAHNVSLNAFWIDKLEITNAMYMLCVQSEACTPPMDWESDKRPSYFNNDVFKDYPVGSAIAVGSTYPPPSWQAVFIMVIANKIGISFFMVVLLK